MKLDGSKVVAIDDAPSILNFLRLSLQYEGADFYSAGTAASGLALCNEVEPDLVILDLGLPDADGLDIVADIKHCSAEVAPKVVILSVRKDKITRDQAFRNGADGYLSKPFVVEDLLDMVENLNSAAK